MIIRGRWAIPLLALLVLMALGAWQWWARDAPPMPAATLPAAGWVDEAGCEGCHAAQYRDWQGSHHHLAMQPATDASVLGDFAQAVLASDVETSRFSRGEAAFRINTPGADGQPADYPVAYTFGVAPLQQYLLALPDGRLQVHGAAWDVDFKRWFHLYDGEGVDHRHGLHWTRPQQNANFMCIECHTTGFRRGYDAGADRFESRWQALGVGCQSCHGPAAGHLRWAEGKSPPTAATASGFERPVGSAGDPREPEVCARCHSRRTPLGDGYTHGNELLDDYLPVILAADLYEVDGKIKDEVFEYGSFRQSRMHAAGVVCSDCHNPHSAQLRAPGNAVCTQCHNPAATPARSGFDASALLAKDYEQPAHHHHLAGSPGSQCVSCHMPGKLYMGNDLRHDHSFSSPHPPQALGLAHSDACLGCHRDSEADAVAARFEQWYPGAEPRDGGYARDLHAARHGQPGAAQALLRQIARSELADIRRATLLSELPSYPSPAAQRAVVEALQDASPLVRRSAVAVAGSLLPPSHEAQSLTALLDDPVRAVRLAAAWQVLQLAPASVSQTDLQARRELIAEYERTQHTMLERAQSHHNLAGIYQLTGRQAEVEPALRRALQQDPMFHPALILLAQGREQAGDADEALRLLQEAIERQPGDASLRHALGLTQVRQGRREQALQSFRQAHERAPEHAEYGYVLAVALHGAGQRQEALALLRGLLQRHPANRAVRQALVSYLRAAGEPAEAAALLRELAALNPHDPLLPRSSHEQ